MLEGSSMIRYNNKLFLKIMFLFLLVLKPFITHAYFQDHITITGPSKIAVGRPNLEYSIIPDINGPFTVISIHFFVEVR